MKSRVFFGACGLGLLIWMVHQIGVETILTSLRPMGVAGLIAILALFAVAQVPACIGWRVLLGSSRDDVALLTLYKAYAVGDALNQTIPSVDVAGEVAKVLMLRGDIPWHRVVASLTIHRIMEVIASALLLAFGLLVSWTRLDLPFWWNVSGLCVLVGMLAFVAGLVWLQSRGIYGPLLDHLGGGTHTSLRSGAKIDREMRQTLAERSRVLIAGLLIFLSWAAGILEVYLCLLWLNLAARWDMAIAIEGFGLFISNLAFFIPGRLGVSEGGRVFLLTAMHIPAPQAMALTVVRRLREIAWIGLGFFLLVSHRRAALWLTRQWASVAGLKPE